MWSIDSSFDREFLKIPTYIIATFPIATIPSFSSRYFTLEELVKIVKYVRFFQENKILMKFRH